MLNSVWKSQLILQWKPLILRWKSLILRWECLQLQWEFRKTKWEFRKMLSMQKFCINKSSNGNFIHIHELFDKFSLLCTTWICNHLTNITSNLTREYPHLDCCILTWMTINGVPIKQYSGIWLDDNDCVTLWMPQRNSLKPNGLYPCDQHVNTPLPTFIPQAENTCKTHAKPV